MASEQKSLPFLTPEPVSEKRKPRRKPFEIHHMVPRSRANEGFEVEHETNLQRLRSNFHTRIHQLFENLTPREQLKLVLDVNLRVLSPRAIQLLSELVQMTKEEFYNPNVLK